MTQHTILIFLKTFSSSLCKHIKLECQFAKEFFPFFCQHSDICKDSTHNTCDSLWFCITHTHSNAGGTSAWGLWLCASWSRVEMLLMGPVVGIHYELQQACSLLARAHFTLSQWHWGLTRAMLLCQRVSPAKLLSGKQANKTRMTPGWGEKKSLQISPEYLCF